MKFSTLFLSLLLAGSVSQTGYALRCRGTDAHTELKQSRRSLATKLGLTAILTTAYAVAAERLELPTAVKNATTFIALASAASFVFYDMHLVDCYGEDYLF